MKKIYLIAGLLLGSMNQYSEDPPFCKTAEECLAGCEKKDAENCDRLSWMYQSGFNIAKDPEKSIQYKMLACENDDAYRCLIAGWEYQYPLYEKSDLKTAEILYKKACDKGDKRGCELILAMKEGRAAKPAKDGTRPPEPTLLCNDPKLMMVEPGSDPPRKKILVASQIDEPPVLQKQVEPDFPAEERHPGRSGKVMIQVIVGEHGEIVSGRVLKADSLPFERAAETAIKKWSYSPPRHCGKPVSVHKMIMVNFNPR